MNYMKKMMYFLFFILILSSYSFAEHSGRGRGRMGHDRMQSDRRLGNDPLKYFRQCGVELSDEQVDKMYTIAIQFLNDEKPIREKIKLINDDIRKELAKSSPDRNVLRELINAKNEQESLRDYLKIIRDLDIIELLTEEQKRQLKSKMRC